MSSVFSPVVTKESYPGNITKLKLESYDHGVDGVIHTTMDTLTAYRVKFRTNKLHPLHKNLVRFWSEAEYADNRCIVYKRVNLPKGVTSKKINHSEIKADVF